MYAFNRAIVVVSASLLLLSGCESKETPNAGGKSSGGNASTKANSATTSPSVTLASGTIAGDSGIAGTGDADAVKAVRAELEKRWLKSTDGYYSVFTPKNLAGERMGPDYDYEIKQLHFAIEPIEISENDKLNGVTFRGAVEFTKTSMRIFNDPHDTGSDHWSPWKPAEEMLTLRAIKQNGAWTIENVGAEFLITGSKPSADDVAKLK